MAVTKIIPIHTTIDKSIAYICNPNKTEQCLFVHSENCFPQTASIEFDMLLHKTRAGANTIGRHLIQSFAPGEVTAEQAHEIGKQLAKKHLQGEYAVIMTTHVDRNHIHNHFVWCAVNLKTNNRYRSNRGTYHEIQRMSDELCKENGLSVIEKKQKPMNKPKLKKLYNLNDDKFQSSKGLTHWAKIQNVKIMAETLNQLRAKGFHDISEFKTKLSSINDEFDSCSIRLKSTENEIQTLKELQIQLRIYGRTKEVYTTFSKVRNKDKFIRENTSAERDIMLHETAKCHLRTHKKEFGNVPNSKEVRAKLQLLEEQKATQYVEYRKIKLEQAELVNLQANLQKMIGKSENEREEIR